MSSEITPADVVVVIPIYRENILELEYFALRHLRKYLHRYPTTIIAPEDLDLPHAVNDFPVERFSKSYFAGIQGYNELLLSRAFYERFKSYKYMLIYQLDALVFSDQLLYFCQMGWDYIGAPWFNEEEDPTQGLSRSGNGGLSLRNIDSFLRVLDSNHYTSNTPVMNFFSILSAPFFVPEKQWLLRMAKRVNIARKARYGIDEYLKNYKWNEDRFWANQAGLFSDTFCVAPAEVGLQFAFEKFPEYCLMQTDGKLPFGCHAWYRYNKDFWETYLEDE